MDGEEYIGKKYTRGKGECRIGDVVMVHPVEKSIARLPYIATIIKSEWGVGTSVEGQHKAAMNDYLFNRLEKIG